MTDTPATQEKASDTLAQAVYQEFKDRPIVITAALKQFSVALKSKYPELQVDVLTATINSPNWVSGERPVLEGFGENSRLVKRQDTWIDGYTRTPLFEVMIHSITAKAQLYFTSEHFLSDVQNKRIAVEMREVEDLLRRLPRVMIPALQQALTDYWNEPAVEGTSRWQWLSDVLRSALLVSMGPSGSGSFLDAEQADTLLQVINCPIKEDRLIQYGPDCAQAFLIDYRARTGRTYRAHLAYDVLVMRKVSGREVVVWFEPSGVIETYDSLQAFADAEGSKWGRRMEISTLELQPYESLGDVFVTQTQALLNNQLEGLNFLGAFEGQDLKALEDRYASLTDLAPHLLKQNPGLYEQTLYGEVSNQLPDWIELATPAETQEYSRYLFRLGGLQQATKGRAYTYGLRTTEQFAKETLLAGMPEYGETLEPDMIEITQTRYIADAPGAPTGTAITETDTLTHRAMKGLAGLLHFNTTIRSRDATALPAWVTEDNLRSLIADVDIGKHYPEEVKKILLEDLEQRPEREKLYANQLRIQLPMLALENKIRKQSGFTDGGYHCVLAVMQSDPQVRRVDGQEIAIWPLAFKTEKSDQPDVVANMFVIGAKNETSGPLILYRPLYPEKLIEFASQNALMEEIEGNTPRIVLASLEEQAGNAQHAQPLQKSILDWLEPDARNIYQDGGFRAPNLPRLIIDPDFPAYLNPAPAEFDKQALSGDLLAQLYEANVKLMTRQAEEQLQSVAEYRWAVLYGLGGRVFDSALNAVFPFLSGPAATFGWLFVTGSAVLQALKALEDGDGEPINDIAFNLLIQLAAVLLTHRLTTDSPVSITPFEPLPILPRPSVAEVETLIKPAIGPGASSTITDSVLDFSSPVSANSRQLLERFISSSQTGVGPLITVAVPKGIEVVNGRWYAKVPGRIGGHGWARVSPAQGENVVVLNNLGAPIKWLELKNNGQDLWDIAPEFRVRGGGQALGALRSYLFGDPRLAARRAAISSRMENLRSRLQAADQSINEAQNLGNAELEKFDADLNEAKALKERSGKLNPRELERLNTLKKKLRIADEKSRKALVQYIERHRSRIALLEEARGVLEQDAEYRRESIRENLIQTAASYGTIDKELRAVAGIWPELGLALDDVFPLAFGRASSSVGVPYNALLELRKRILKSFPERINASRQLESTMAELLELDLRLTNGQHSERVKLLIKGMEERPHNTDQLKIQELVCTRGALAGDPTITPTLTEATGLEGLGQLPIGRSAADVLELQGSEGFTLDERLRVLRNAIEHYDQADMLAGYLSKRDHRQTYTPELFLKLFRDLLKEHRQSAQEQLTALLREQVLGEVEPSIPQAPARKPARKRVKNASRRVIETEEGVQVGDVRPAGSTEPDETVVVQNPDNKQETVFYRHEGDRDEFYQRRIIQRPAVPKKPALEMSVLLNEGTGFLRDLDELIRSVNQPSNRPPEPQGQEDSLLRQAKKLDDTASAISRKVPDLSGTERATAIEMVRKLRAAIDRLTLEGRRLHAEGAKKLPPNAGSFKYLLELEPSEISVGESRWKEEKDGGFLLEYDIYGESPAPRRGSKKPLWYAHFHCSAKNVNTLSKGHLKLERLRFVTLEDQVRDPKIGPDKAIPSGNMQTSFAQNYFFRPYPPTV